MRNGSHQRNSYPSDKPVPHELLRHLTTAQRHAFKAMHKVKRRQRKSREISESKGS